jgi:hypothetical protein
MRKQITCLVGVFLAATLVPDLVMASERVFEANVVQCGTPGTPSGCGSNPAASDPLERGSVEVGEDGRVGIELIGAVPTSPMNAHAHGGER